MPRKTSILYLLLIGIPALLLTLAAVRLLMGVREQLAALEQDRNRNIAEKVSREVNVWLTALQTDLLRQVETLPQADLPLELRTFQRESPFVRNVFVWEKEKGVVFPLTVPIENEEQRFLIRFAPLFKGDYAWQENTTEGETSSSLRSKVQVLKRRSGWIPWFEGNQLHLLGWTELGPKQIAGVELEMSAVLARLTPVLVPWTYGRQGGQGVELTTGQDILLSTGMSGVADESKAESNRKSAFELSLAPTLPHWTLKIYPAKGSAKVAERTILLLGGIVILLLAGSLIAGGVLLVRDAARQRHDALQKTMFVSNVSHELKTPLTSIRMYAELLADNKAQTAEAVKQYLGVIVTESERLTRLVNNVLDFGRLEQKRRTYHCETLVLADYVTAAVEPLRGIVESADMKLVVKSETEARVLADRDALNQVLVNVIDNACKYASEGKEITITSGIDGRKAYVRVADRGPGIPRALAGRIFERFFRVDDSVTATVGGSGLGLSIAKQLLQGMGGDVQWSAREGGGSVFTVTLPMEEKA
jgi:signal transduction histidine kinase